MLFYVDLFQKVILESVTVTKFRKKFAIYLIIENKDF